MSEQTIKTLPSLPRIGDPAPQLEKVVVPPPTSQQLAEERVKDESLEVTDWYLSKKNLPNV